MLGLLDDNGRPTLTHLPSGGSPLLQAGVNFAGSLFDQRGQPRVSGGKADIGSVEVQVAAAPPTAKVYINNAAVQRSMVTSLKLEFSEAVTFPSGPASAIQLNRTGPDVPTGSVNLSFTQAGSTVFVTFTDSTFAPAGGSLLDGRYTLTLMATNIVGAGGQLDGDGNGTGGDNLVANFHRLFGDGDGNAAVNFNDFLSFRSTFGLKMGATGSNPAFDSDGDGDVDFNDFLQFRARFGTAISP